MIDGDVAGSQAATNCLLQQPQKRINAIFFSIKFNLYVPFLSTGTQNVFYIKKVLLCELTLCQELQ